MDKAILYANKLYVLIDDIAMERKALERQVSLLDSEQDDLLHEIELAENVNAYEGYMLYRELKLLRQRRRVVKDALESMVCLDDMVRHVINKDKVRGMVDRLEQRKERERTYEPKVRKNLRLVSNS